MLSIGIVGLPNVGKSTLFNALTKSQVDAQNYLFCTIDPSVGVVPVPDERLSKLAELSKSAKTIPAIVQFVDIAGLVKGAASGEGLGNQFLSHIREVDAIAHVVRIFENKNITHVSGRIDPLDDIGVINLELVLADYECVSRRRGNIAKDVKRGDKIAKAENEILTKLEKNFDEGKFAKHAGLTDEEKEIVSHLNLLTLKPMLYVLNKQSGSENLGPGDERYDKLVRFFEDVGAVWVLVDAKIEDDLKGLEGEERDLFRNELEISGEDGVKELIRKSYDLLGLITYFTTGEDETRGWTIPENSTAPRAGRAIHGDFEDKFIRASVVFWKDLLDLGGMAGAREKGLLRTEGKEYVVKDGDVIEFKI